MPLFVLDVVRAAGITQSPAACFKPTRMKESP